MEKLDYFQLREYCESGDNFKIVTARCEMAAVYTYILILETDEQGLQFIQENVAFDSLEQNEEDATLTITFTNDTTLLQKIAKTIK